MGKIRFEDVAILATKTELNKINKMLNSRFTTQNRGYQVGTSFEIAKGKILPVVSSTIDTNPLFPLDRLDKIKVGTILKGENGSFQITNYHSLRKPGNPRLNAMVDGLYLRKSDGKVFSCQYIDTWQLQELLRGYAIKTV